MTKENILEIIEIMASSVEEMRKQTITLPSQIDTIKAFLFNEIVRRDHSLDTSRVLVAELNKCADQIPGWLIDEIYQPKPPVVTLGKT